jgi:hypothetical protein
MCRYCSARGRHRAQGFDRREEITAGHRPQLPTDGALPPNGPDGSVIAGGKKIETGLVRSPQGGNRGARLHLHFVMDEEPRLPTVRGLPRGRPDGSLVAGGKKIETGLVRSPQGGNRGARLHLHFVMDEEPRLPTVRGLPRGRPDGSLVAGGKKIEMGLVRSPQGSKGLSKNK